MALVHLDSTLGAAYIGNLIAAILYGMTILQTFLFFRTSGKDGMSLRIMVFCLFVLDTLQLAFVAHAIYYYTVTNFDNPSALAYATWSIMGHLLVTSITDLLVRYIFGKRLWRLTDRNWLLAISVAGVSLFVFGCGMAFAIRAFRIRAFADTGKISWLLYSSLGAGVIADCLIAISLCVWLLRIRTGFKRTDSLLNVLMLYSINTGMVTSLCAIVCFVTYAITPNRFYYVATSFVLSKLNVNCLLASLNARSPLRDQMCRSPTGSFVTNTGGSEEDGAQSTPSSLVVRVDIVTDKNTSPLEDQHAKYCLV